MNEAPFEGNEIPTHILHSFPLPKIEEGGQNNGQGIDLRLVQHLETDPDATRKILQIVLITKNGKIFESYGARDDANQALTEVNQIGQSLSVQPDSTFSEVATQVEFFMENPQFLTLPIKNRHKALAKYLADQKTNHKKLV
ncbi:hypothetical protein JXA05_00725 [Candidatus Peregrinibacteria bacterium]|nr:hypothetical protein [Candidatus Peregrinibacteria bacterium]